MAADDEDDLFDDEFEFVDDVDDSDEDSRDDEEYEVAAEKNSYNDDAAGRDSDDEDAEPSRPEPPANHVVHVYEYRQYKRTIDRPFTAEDAEAFASEYNRTAKPYGRFAVAGKDDAKPRKSLE
jgi:hypothetical protein